MAKVVAQAAWHAAYAKGPAMTLTDAATTPMAMYASFMLELQVAAEIDDRCFVLWRMPMNDLEWMAERWSR